MRKRYLEMDLSKITLRELARQFFIKHNQKITPEALSYRLKKGMSREEALEKPLENRGRTSTRKKLRSGRKARRDKLSGTQYCYLHIDVPGNGCLPKVRYVGRGQGGRCLHFLGRQTEHRDWICNWFANPSYQRIEIGVAPSKLLHLDWLDLKSKQMWVIVTHPFLNGSNFEARLLRIYNTVDHSLLNTVMLQTV